MEKYLAWLDRLTEGAEPVFHRVETAGGAAHQITVIVYHDVPERGMLTGLTYGLSLAGHPEWRQGRPELCISVTSEDERWALAVGYLASTLVHDCPFAYGDTINVGEPIAGDTAMTAFVVFAPAVLDREDFLNVLDAPDGAGPEDVVNIAGLYPIHDSERRFIHSHGLEAFWSLDWDPFAPGRPSAV